jgi:hypothetical protein
MKRAFLLLVAALVAAASALPALPAQAYQAASAKPAPVFTEFCATLLQANEVPAPGAAPVEFTGAYGSARLLLNRQTRELSFDISVTGIPSATLAHIHQGIVGVSGPVEINLLPPGQPFGPTNPLTGSVVLDAQQVADLYAGRYYVNVHTVKYPGGELRGQVFPREVTRVFKTRLLGQNETPPVAGPGTGEAIIRLSDARTQLAYSISFSNTNPITLTHIHTGSVGVPGPVLYNLLPPGETVQPGETLTGTLPVSQTQGGVSDVAALTALFGGGLYVNAHSAAFPAGEVRGQLGPATTRLVATLNGGSEVPPNGSAGIGYASVDLSPASGQLEFALTVSGITSTVLFAHIHDGDVGENGDIVVTLVPAGTPFPDGATLRGTAYLTRTEEISRALSGGYYVNVHSAAIPAGELRGQLLFQPRNFTYAAALDAAQEVQTPPVSSDASGRSALTVGNASPGNYQLAYTLLTTGITPSLVVGSHIHRGQFGQNGPIVIDLLAAQSFSTTLTGTATLNAFGFDTMTSGFNYVNVHTQAFQNGEIRGQIYPQPIALRYFAGLSNRNEVPPVTNATASGFAELQLDPETQTQLSVAMEVRAPEPIIGAHIHRAPAGQNGGIRFDLTGSKVEEGFYGVTLTLEPGDINDLVLQFFYLNVHTQSNQSGVARGQILAQNSRRSLPVVGRNFGDPTPGAKLGPGLSSLAPAPAQAPAAAPALADAAALYICGVAHGT